MRCRRRCWLPTNVNVNFGAGLNPGFFSTINVSALDPLLINLNVTDILVLQRVVAKTGTASRLGIASKNPPTVGSSPANPIYQVGVSPPPVSTVCKSWSQLKKLYR